MPKLRSRSLEGFTAQCRDYVLPIRPITVRHSGASQFGERRNKIADVQNGYFIDPPRRNAAIRPTNDERHTDAAFVERVLAAAQRAIGRAVGSDAAVVAGEDHDRVIPHGVHLEALLPNFRQPGASCLAKRSRQIAAATQILVGTSRREVRFQYPDSLRTNLIGRNWAFVVGFATHASPGAGGCRTHSKAAEDRRSPRRCREVDCAMVFRRFWSAVVLHSFPRWRALLRLMPSAPSRPEQRTSDLSIRQAKPALRGRPCHARP